MPAPEWSDLCPQTVVIERMTGRDSYTKPVYAAPESSPPPLGGRREFKQVRKGGQGGVVEYVNGSIIYALAAPDVKLEDRVYLLGDVEPFPPVLSVERPQDETGEYSYSKITLGPATG
jgi:hypothetical protein